MDAILSHNFVKNNKLICARNIFKSVIWEVKKASEKVKDAIIIDNCC